MDRLDTPVRQLPGFESRMYAHWSTMQRNRRVWSLRGCVEERERESWRSSATSRRQQSSQQSTRRNLLLRAFMLLLYCAKRTTICCRHRLTAALLKAGPGGCVDLIGMGVSGSFSDSQSRSAFPRSFPELRYCCHPPHARVAPKQNAHVGEPGLCYT